MGRRGLKRAPSKGKEFTKKEHKGYFSLKLANLRRN
jgi:hypothetical protein